MSNEEAVEKVDAFIREHNIQGQCKVISLGANCPCALCAFDALRAALAAQDEIIAAPNGYVTISRVVDDARLEEISKLRQQLAAPVAAEVEERAQDAEREGLFVIAATLRSLSRQNESLRAAQGGGEGKS